MSFIYVLDNNQEYSDHVTLVFEHELDFLDDLKVLLADSRGPCDSTWSVDWCAEARVLLRPKPPTDPLCFFDALLLLCYDDDEDRLAFACSLPRLGPLVLEWKRQRDAELVRQNEELRERAARNRAATPSFALPENPNGITCASCGGVFVFPPDSNTGTCACGATCEVSPSHLTWSPPKRPLTAMDDGSTQCDTCKRFFADLRSAIDHDCDWDAPEEGAAPVEVCPRCGWEGPDASQCLCYTR